jgi:hypothetical protein
MMDRRRFLLTSLAAALGGALAAEAQQPTERDVRWPAYARVEIRRAHSNRLRGTRAPRGRE